MRRLTIHRQRGLACFGVPYFCIPGSDTAALDALLPGQYQEGVALSNGQKVTIRISERPGQFFVALCTASRRLTTELGEIPAGDEDVCYTVITEYDGNRRLQLRLAEGILPYTP